LVAPISIKNKINGYAAMANIVRVSIIYHVCDLAIAFLEYCSIIWPILFIPDRIIMYGMQDEIKRTYWIYEDLDTEIKIRAARERKRYSDVVVEALEKHLGMKPRDKKKK
jgi:hypothetical protein